MGLSGRALHTSESAFMTVGEMVCSKYALVGRLLTLTGAYFVIAANSAYLPTSGQDNEFLHVLSQLSFNIESNITNNTTVLIGLDSNQSTFQ